MLCIPGCCQVFTCHAQVVPTAHSGGSTGSQPTSSFDAAYTLKPQDVLAINFPLSAEFDQTVTVMQDGFINLNAAKNVYVESLTVPQAADAVKMAYAGVLHEPIVSIEVKNFQTPYFTVLGQVNKPGKYDLRQRTSLPEAVAIAGGFASTARTQIVLLRPVSGQTAEVIPFPMNKFLNGKGAALEPVDLRPGDMIFVPEKFITKFKRYVNYGSIGGISASSVY